MTLSAIDEINESIKHDRAVINTLKSDKDAIDQKLRYYEGHYDGMNTALDILKAKELEKS